MSEQDHAAEVQPTADSPNDGAGTEQVNWENRVSELEKRISDTQAWGHQHSEQLAEVNRLLEAARNGDREAAEALGFAYADEDTEVDGEPTPYLTREEWQQYQAQQAQQQASSAEQQQIADLDQQANKDLERLSVPEHLRDWVFAHAVMHEDPTADGHINIEAAYKRYADEVRKADQKLWADSKRTHAMSPVGEQGTQTPDFDQMSRGERDAWMTERIRALSQD